MTGADNIWIVFKKEWREQWSTSVPRTMLGIPVLIIFITYSMSRRMPSLIGTLLDFLFTFYALGITFMVQGMLTVPVYGKEKISRTEESLLATPLSLSHILLGKALLISGVSFILSSVTGIGALVLMNMSLHGTGVVWPPLEALVFFAVVLPLFSFSLSTFLGLLLMYGLPVSGVSSLSGFVSMGLLYFPKYLSKVSAGRWGVDLVSEVMALLILATNYALYRLLTKERVITGIKPTTMRCCEDSDQC